jgi:squalene-associated FAD-dependent desaturase
MSGAVTSARERPDIDVIVIGAGFAGLAAATALAEAGLRARVCEARPALGGRATAFRDPATRERIDNGQHVIAGCYSDTLAFLRRIGTDGLLHRPSTLRVPMIDETGRRSVLRLPPLPSPLHLVAGVMAWDAIGLSDRVSVLQLRHGLRERDSRRLRDETVRQWLTRHGQSPALVRLLWEPLALAALNQSIDIAAADAFLTVIALMFGTDPDASTLLLPAVPLDDLYCHPAHAFLTRRGSSVAANAPCRLAINGDRVTGVTVRGRHTAARAVVSAVPWFAFPALFEASAPRPLEGLVDAARRLGSAPIVTVNLWFDADVMDEPFVGLPGRTFQWAFDGHRLTGPGQTQVSLVASGADEVCAGTNEQTAALALGDLVSAIPPASRARVRHARVVRERRATFSLGRGEPPRPPTVTPLDGLVLAGDWIDTGLPATIESAVRSGHQAARHVLSLLS